MEVCRKRARISVCISESYCGNRGRPFRNKLSGVSARKADRYIFQMQYVGLYLHDRFNIKLIPVNFLRRILTVEDYTRAAAVKQESRKFHNRCTVCEGSERKGNTRLRDSLIKFVIFHGHCRCANVLSYASAVAMCEKRPKIRT